MWAGGSWTVTRIYSEFACWDRSPTIEKREKASCSGDPREERTVALVSASHRAVVSLLDTHSVAVWLQQSYRLDVDVCEADTLLGSVAVPKIVFHLTQDGIDNWRAAARFELYKRIADMAADQGGAIEIQRITQTTGSIVNGPGDHDLHLVHGGSIKGIGWLNSSISYLQGFWHIDRDGILANSSARNHHFDPSQVKRRAAEAFFEQLNNEFVRKRFSRYNQREKGTDLPQEYIAVFLQGRYPYIHRQNYFSMPEMLQEVLLGSGSIPVVVKPHPLERSYGLAAVDEVIGAGGRVVVTNANVHDVISKAVVVVSVNSSVTFEAFMNRKPSIVFGRTDHSSLVETVRRPGEFAVKLKGALARDWDYAGMLHWYFKNHTIRINSRRFQSSLTRAIETVGRDPNSYKIFGA